MILKIALLQEPASDLGYLLHKNPTRIHEAEFSFGKGYVAFKGDDRAMEAGLILDIDAVGLVRGGATYDQYVNDRPYAASSFISSAMSEFYSTAMSGRSKERQELADSELPFRFELPVLRSKSGEGTIRSMLEPLGYELEIEALGSHFFKVVGTYRGLFRDFLSHLYVLIPVIDNDKHYFVGKQEVQKLFLRAERWLPGHPLRETITRRYLRFDRILTREAIQRLNEFESDEDSDDVIPEPATKEKRVTLHDQRLEAVTEMLASLRVTTVVDLGCGEGRLLQHLNRNRQFRKILGMDVCLKSLDWAEKRLNLNEGSARKRERMSLIHGSLMYRDERISGFEAAAVVEVIEHMDLPRLAAFERVLFEFARPQYAVVTTPNQEYNAVFETMDQGAMRHEDHRFEWTRAEFVDWCEKVASSYGYQYEIRGIGDEHIEYGAPSQMAVFRK